VSLQVRCLKFIWVTSDYCTGEHIQLTALRWIDSFFDICPGEMLLFIPRLLNEVLPALSSPVAQVRMAGGRVNSSLIDYIMSLPDDVEHSATKDPNKPLTLTTTPGNSQGMTGMYRWGSNLGSNVQSATGREGNEETAMPPQILSPTSPQLDVTSQSQVSPLDYEAAVNALTLQFQNEHEATRAASLTWLIMLQKKAPGKVRSLNSFLRFYYIAKNLCRS